MEELVVQRAFRRPVGAGPQMPLAEGVVGRKDRLTPKLSGSDPSGQK